MNRIKNIIIDEDTFGITQGSLRMLRNALARNINQYIVIFEVPTNNLRCGFMILNKNTCMATFTGDGFRVDGGGEGEAGYKSAYTLFGLFGIGVYLYYRDPVDIDGLLYKGKTFIKQKFLAIAQNLANNLKEEQYVKPALRNPVYVRN